MIKCKMSYQRVFILVLVYFVFNEVNSGVNSLDGENYSFANNRPIGTRETALENEGLRTTITSHSPLKTWLLKGTSVDEVENEISANEVSRNEVIESDGRVLSVVDESSLEAAVNGEQLKDIRFGKKDIVIKSNPLDVLYGRVTLISSVEHLYISVREHDNCIVKVINDRAFLPRAGLLHPSEFDCQFGQNDVWYSHLGGRNPQMDTIKLLIKYQTNYNTFIIPAALQIRVIYNKQLEVVTKNVPLKVEKNLGISNYINLSNTVFSYDKKLFECFVNIFTEDDQLPRYGSFSSSNLKVGTKPSFLCDELLDGNFSYKQSVSSSLRTDFVPVKIDLYSRENGSLVKQEFFHKTVIIPTGKANSPPFIVNNSTLYLDVYHAFLTPLTQKTLLFHDKETSKDRILIVLKSSLDPNEGKLISTDNPRTPIVSFHQMDISDLKIAFIPSANTKSDETLRLLKVSLVAIDEEGASSAAIEVTIAIHYWNGVLPQSMKFEDLFLQEGESKIINLITGSKDNGTYLTNYQIVDGLKHGHIILNGNITQSFTSIDLDAHLVAYNHDGSETVSDNMVIELFTNFKIFELLFPVSIFPVDDSSPKLTIINELELKTGSEIQIKELNLKAEDTDNENSIINYKLLRPFPKHGYFALKEFVSPGYSSSLNFVNRSNVENEVTEWTQEDIKDGRLFFIVKDQQAIINDTETAIFTINDDSDPPNFSEKQNLTIKIIAEDFSVPYLYKVSSKLLSTFEHQMISVTEEYLLYGIRSNESGDSDMLIIYNFATNETTGTFHFSHNLHDPINNFSQRQINDNSIIYRPPDHEIGLNAITINIVYNLSYNETKLNNQTFSVAIKPVNNMPPDVHMEQAKITNGSYDIILTRKILKILDKDTDEAELLFRLVSLPRYGNVLYKKQNLFPGSEFTIKDIENENIRYESNMKEVPNNDFFTIEVDDRIHRIQFTVDIVSERDVMNSIDITSENDAMSLQSGNALSLVLAVNESSSVTITSVLWSADIMPTGNITYIIEKAPQNGIILRNDKSILKFLWEDIQNEAVVYAHDGEEIGMNPISDQFSLMVLSSSPAEHTSIGAESHSIKIDVLINPVDNSPPDVTFPNPVHVTESLYTTLGVEEITLADVDSDINNVICMTTKHPNYGYLKRKENDSEPLKNFTGTDLTDKSIKYFQNIHNKTEHRSDYFSFQCSDSVQKSPEKVMEIIIEPYNDEVPETTVDQIVVNEGSYVQLLSTHLNTEDLDEPEDIIVYSISTYPKYGKLATNAKDDNVVSFLQKDVLNGKIWYFHDGSETLTDYFELTVSDGILEHEKSVTLQVSIIPVDDQLPEIKVNMGITVNMNSSKIITNEVLFSTDLDTGIESIIYILKSLPRFGVLELQSRNNEGTPKKLSFEQTFTQKDIDDLLVRYRNTIYTASNDSFSFTLKDANSNTRSNNPMIFKIELKDTIPPTIYNDDVELFRGGWVYITKEVLKVIDLNTPDKFLTFSITKKPLRGELKHADNSASEVNSFTQLDIGANKILYVHNSKFNESSDTFGYSVTDGFNMVQRNFRIHIDDANAEKPILHLSPVEVEKGLSTIVTNSNLKIEDNREPPKDLTFIITRYPRFGNILLEQKRKISKFSQEQVNERKISYHHDGSKDDMDDFQVLITDGFHEDFFLYPNLDVSTNEPQVVHIKINPREQLTLKDGLKQGLQPQFIPRNKFKGIKAKIIFQITTKNLNAEGVTHPGSVIYIIEEPPKSGYICNMKDVMKPLSSFTQDDINNGVIRFVFNEDTKATYDIVKFRLMDEVKGLTTTGKVQFEWSFIKLEKDFYAVNQSEQVDIFLLRRGSLEPAESVNLTVYNANDEPMFTNQAKFNPGDDKVKWTFKAAKHEDFAEVETVRVKISDGVMAATEEPDEATIFIRDNAEESIVEFTQEFVKVPEKSKKIKLKVKRVGDTYKAREVLCYTVAGTANGTRRGKVDDYSDYVTRPKDKSSLIRFKARQTDTFCEIQIIDDSQVESEESFTVHLASINGGRIGTRSNVTIKIEEDASDCPHIFFAKPEHYINEGAALFEIWVFRSGSDLRSTSTVEVVAKSKIGKSKLARKKKAVDVLVTSLVEFPPESKSQPVTVSVLDDSGNSLIEGLEAFTLELKNAKNAKVNERSETSVIIKDRTVNVPLFEFTSDEIRVVESDSLAKILISRKGDSLSSASVRCYTRSGSATDDVDYTGRPDSDSSVVSFQKGDTERYCDVRIIDDFLYEKDEYFGVFLSSPEVERGKAIVGPKNFAKVVIDDGEDEPVVFFETSQIQTTEPNLDGDVFEIKIKIHRKNYLSSWVLLRVYTKDASATSGEDYIGLNKELYFYPDSSEVELIIEILGDSKVEPRESFTVNLEYLKSSTLQDMKVTTSEVVIFIEDPKVPKDKVFPAPPIVVSTTSSFGSRKTVPPGFSVLCLTACDEQHPQFIRTNHLCKEQNINNNLTIYRWQISSNAAPSSKQKGTEAIGPKRWKQVPQTFFTKSNSRVLDKLFITPMSLVQCYATAVSHSGHSGSEAKSAPVSVNFEGGHCPSKNVTHIDALPYVAKVKYIDSKDWDHPNTVSVEVLVPHQDGMIPIISTRRITSVSLIISVDSYRVSSHKCSNLLDLKKHLLQKESHPSGLKKAAEHPFEHSFSDRMETGAYDRFYRNLNEEACLWKWTGFFSISELVTYCGAEMVVGDQVTNVVQNQLQIKIPIFVTYAFYAADVEGSWRHIHQSSELRINLAYDSSILLSEGLQSTSTEAVRDDDAEVSSTLKVIGLQTEKDGRISVDFTTESEFRGKFLSNNSVVPFKNGVTLIGQPTLTFTLKEIHSTKKENQNIQTWRFVSDFAVQDYSGTYLISLIPCISADEDFSLVEVSSKELCNSAESVNFELEIKLQQVMNLVAEQFSLNSRLRVTKNETEWFDLKKTGDLKLLDTVFYPGDRIYGNVFLDPVEDLANGIQISIEKCFVCTAFHNYVPKFDPQNGEYGCLKNTEDIQTFNLIDKRDSEAEDLQIKGIPFNARLLQKESTLKSSHLPSIEKMDGFSFDVQPLFQNSGGERWFIHVIFELKRKDRQRFKRQTLFQEAISRKTWKETKTTKAEESDSNFDDRKLKSNSLQGLGPKDVGTNMCDFYLKPLSLGSGTYNVIDWKFLPQFLVAFMGVVVLVACVSIASTVFYNRRNRKEPRISGFYSTVAMTDRTMTIDKPETKDEHKPPKVLSFYSSYDEVTEV